MSERFVVTGAHGSGVDWGPLEPGVHETVERHREFAGA